MPLPSLSYFFSVYADLLLDVVDSCSFESFPNITSTSFLSQFSIFFAI